MISKLKKMLLQMVRILTPEELRLLDSMVHQRLAADSVKYPEHRHYAYWESLIDVWDTVPSPFRPSTGDVAIYRDLLTRAAEGPILILGSTPELRDLVAKDTNRRVYVADFSYRMPAAMLKFTQHVDPLKEVWLKCNWLELPCPPDFFGAVLGDLVLQQLPPELEPAFLEKMATLLKPGGLLISRCQVLNDHLQTESAGVIVQRTLSSPLTNWQKVLLLKAELLERFSDRQTRVANRPLAARQLSQCMRTQGSAQPILEAASRALLDEHDAFRYWAPSLEATLTSILSGAYAILDKRCAADYENAAHFPVFALRSRTTEPLSKT